MKILNNKLVSCESETVEYESLEEFNNDKPIRKEQGWFITTRPNFYEGVMEQVIKYNNDKLVVKWVRYGHINIG